MGTDDADLIRRWQHEDRTAFEALVRRWQQPVASFLFRLVGRAGPVPDLCQEVFLRVYHAGPRYREAGAFSAWLHRIALNVVRDAARRRQHPLAPLEEADLADDAPSADAICFRQEMEQAVARAVAELPLPLREVLALRHYEGMSFEQIARLTGTPASTLKSRFAAALGRLRERLRELGWGPEESDP